MKKIVFTLLLIINFPSLSWFDTNTIEVNNKNKLHQFACKDGKKSDSAWNVTNLYNCNNNTLFIPYQLWSGAKWDGNKDAPCMHKADTLFYVNDESGTTIKGPQTWEHPETGDEIDVWFREKINGSKQQYFTCNDKGIGRVYDSRRGGRSYKLGRCKFPAGYGWSIGTQRKCKSTAIEIIKVELDSNNNLSAIEFKWWYKNRSEKYIHDHTYRDEPNIGSVNAWKQ